MKRRKKIRHSSSASSVASKDRASLLRNSFKLSLTDDDEICVRLGKCSNRIVSFCIQLKTNLAGKWHEILRIDASENEAPNMHVFYPDGIARKVAYGALRPNYAKDFHYALKNVQDRYPKRKEEYLTKYDKLHNS